LEARAVGEGKRTAKVPRCAALSSIFNPHDTTKFKFRTRYAVTFRETETALEFERAPESNGKAFSVIIARELGTGQISI
jgi:hypothetical protein